MLFCNICSVSHFMKRSKQKQIKEGGCYGHLYAFSTVFTQNCEVKKNQSTKNMQQEILQCIIDAKYGLSNENG